MEESSQLQEFRVDEVSRLALAHISAPHRQFWVSLFALNTRLRQMVRHAEEPILAQVRLAWWRDELTKASRSRTLADPLVRLLDSVWGQNCERLVPLIDGWEAILTESQIDHVRLDEFCHSRGSAMALASEASGFPDSATYVATAGSLWALAERASGEAAGANRKTIVAKASELLNEPVVFPRALRGVAVIHGLACRSIKRHGQPILGDRMSPLVALRIGFFGR